MPTASVLRWGAQMKAEQLLKANVDALLRARHQSRHDLAMWCRRSDAWLSKILGKDNRNVPLEYLDRIADFFGVAAYQLFQPGISLRFERRKGERRSMKDRRLAAMNQRVRQSLSEAVASLSQTDVADMIRLKTLSEKSRDAARAAMQALEDSERQAARRGHTRPDAGTGATGATTRPGRSKIKQVNAVG
jgi:hypothetical protein